MCVSVISPATSLPTRANASRSAISSAGPKSIGRDGELHVPDATIPFASSFVRLSTSHILVCWTRSLIPRSVFLRRGLSLWPFRLRVDEASHSVNLQDSVIGETLHHAQSLVVE